MDNIEKYLRDIEKKVEKNAEIIIERNAKILLNQIKTTSPVDTGFMRDNFTYKDGNIYTGAEYTKFVEYGTRYIQGRYFISDAVKFIESEFINDLRRNLMKW